MLTKSQMIELYRLALLRLVAGLFVRAGIEPGGEGVETLPRFVRSAIFLVLRQVESATRRLAFSETEGMEIPEYVPREKPDRKKRKSAKARLKSGASRIPQFRLIDPRVFLEELYPHRKPRGSNPKRERRTERELIMRITNFDGRPPFEMWAEADPVLSPDDELTAVAICRRLQAVHHALSDLQKQAQRMVREIAKRRAAKPGPESVPPLRCGFPPGHRKRRVHEVDGILHECHQLAMRVTERAPHVGV